MKNVVSKSHKKKITDDIDKIIKGYEKIISVYIFGSFMTGSSFSDIDIGILSDEPVPNPLNLELALESEIEKKVKYPVDIRILNEAPISFSQNVIRQGKILIDRNPNTRADFENMVLKKYFDISPFRRRYLKEVSNAII